jgi:hypothetical protein
MLLLLVANLLLAPDEPPRFVATSPADDRPTGQIQQLNRDFTALLKTPNGDKTVANLISLHRVNRVLPAYPTGPHLISTAGDRIVGTLVGGDERSLRFLPSAFLLKPRDAWKVPLASAVVVWMTDTPARTPLNAVRYSWLADLRNQDVLRFRNGDTIRGTIDGLDPDAERTAIAFRSGQGAVKSIAARDLAAMAFNPALARFRKPKGTYARLVLTDGSRLALSNVTIDNEVVRGVTLFGQKTDLPLSTLLALDVVAGKATYLSDLKPKHVDQRGFLGAVWSWKADRTVRGEALRIQTPDGASIADKGLGTHPRTLLSYSLNGKYRWFEARVSLDPDTAVRGNAAVRVLVDGKEQTIAGLPSLGKGNAIPIRISLSGAKELTLITDFGSAGGVGADVNWADARLVE